MIKRLLYVTVLLAFAFTANAQELKRSNNTVGLKYNKVAKNAPATRASASNVPFTYAQGQSVSLVGAGATSYDCAIFIPGDFAGNTIDMVAFYLVDLSSVSNVRYWINPTLPTSVSSTNCAVYNTVTPTHSLTSDGYPEMVETSYTIPSGGCYVGYSFTANPILEYGYYCLAFDGMTDIEGGAYANWGNGWQNFYGQGYGNFLTTVVMSGNNFMGDAVTLFNDEFSKNAVVNGNVGVSVNFLNKGLNNISSLSYTVKDVATGNVSDEMSAAVDNVAFCEIGTATFQVPAGTEVGGPFEKEITVTKVNGVANEFADANVTVNGELNKVVTRNVTRKVVVEEITGTGCPNCPRGYAGMEAMEETYPNEFIGIASHASVNYYDPMETSVYDEVWDRFGNQLGIPSALLNRTNDYEIFDPYFGSSSSTMLGVLDDFEAQRGAAEAEVVVCPMWGNQSQTQINVNTDITFLYNRDDAPYALAYVLVTDGLQGDGTPYWWQYNGIYGVLYDEPYWDTWAQKGVLHDDIFVDENENPVTVPMIEDMVYNHVALMSQNLTGTTTGEIKAPIVADAKQSASTTFDISNGVKGSFLQNELIQDKSKLKVVAMLINTETGEIVNADEKEIAAYDPTGIENVTATGEEAVEVARYALDGTQLSVPTKGVNIVKMSDGTTKKVIVK